MVPFEEKNGGETVSDGGGKGERRRLFLISCFCLLEGGGGVGGSPLLRGGKKVGGAQTSRFFQEVDEGGGLLLPLFPPGGRGVKLTSPGESGRTNGYMAPPSSLSPFLLAVRPIPSPPAFKVSFSGHPLPLGTLTRPRAAVGQVQRTCDSKLKTIVVSIVI